jgi:hypothetical protein
MSDHITTAEKLGDKLATIHQEIEDGRDICYVNEEGRHYIQFADGSVLPEPEELYDQTYTPAEWENCFEPGKGWSTLEGWATRCVGDPTGRDENATLVPKRWGMGNDELGESLPAAPPNTP